MWCRDGDIPQVRAGRGKSSGLTPCLAHVRYGALSVAKILRRPYEGKPVISSC